MIQAAAYIKRRLLVRKLDWKTSFEAVMERKPKRAHMEPISCKAYSWDRDAIKTKARKLDPRAHVGYLVEWDSTNIFRIWILLKKKKSYLNQGCKVQSRRVLSSSRS
jgi:hypothetical protein